MRKYHKISNRCPQSRKFNKFRFALVGAAIIFASFNTFMDSALIQFYNIIILLVTVGDGKSKILLEN